MSIYLEASEIKVQKERGIKLQFPRTCKFTWKLCTGCFALYEDYRVEITTFLSIGMQCYI